MPPPTPSDKTEVEKNPDGSTTTTVTKPDGSQTITHETAAGTESVVKKDEDGKVELPSADAESGSDVERASVVEVKVPASVSDKAPVQVTVPVAKDEGDELNYGIVVFAVDAEGLFTGDDVTGELNPTDGAARAEVATVLMRFINLMYA